MSNNVKIIISACILAFVVSLLFVVIPITSTFVVSYIFTLIAILGITLSLCNFKFTKVIQGYAFIYTGVLYSVLSVIFSVIACAFSISLKWTIIVHIGIFAVFLIITIALTSGSNYIEKIDAKDEQKHEEFKREKESYWSD